MAAVDQLSARDIEFRSIFALLKRQSRTILLTALVIFLLAFAFLFTVTPTFTSTALILVNPDTQSILNTNASGPVSSGRDNARIDSEVEIIRSDAVSLAVIENEALTSDKEFAGKPSYIDLLAQSIGVANAASSEARNASAKSLARLKQATTVRRKGLTYLITVSVTSSSPTKAAYLANKISETYIQQQVQAKVARSLAARDVLNDQIITARQALTSYEIAFEQYLAKNSDQLTTGTNGTISALEAEIGRLEVEIAQKQQDRSGISELMKLRNWQSVGTSLSDRALNELLTQRNNLATVNSGSGAANENVDIQQALNELDKKLLERSNARLTVISAELRDMEQGMSGLREQLRRAVLAVGLSPDMMIDIYAIQQESNVARAQYDDLLLRMRDLDIQANIQIADSQVVSAAIAPIKATFPDKNLVLLSALAASMGLGIGLAFLKEYYIGGLTSTSQLSELLKVPSSSGIPAITTTDSGQNSLADRIVNQPLSPYSEAFRKLRATLDQRFRNQNSNAVARPNSGKVILVTSSLANEGKTTAALSLARTYAQSGQKTLLIDADLRKPSIHTNLGIEPICGFADYLRDPTGTQLTGSFYARDPESQLVLILGAQRSEIPTDQLISSVTFEALIEQAKEVYGVIIIDSPPLLPVVDARYIAHHADALVLIVKWADTNQSDLLNAVGPLREALKPDAAFVPVLAQLKGPESSSAYDSYSAAI